MKLDILIYFMLFIVVFILFYNGTLEHLTSNEAVQNVAALYNASNLTVTNATISGALTTGTFNLLPTGIIVAWTGNTPPTGWILCDGTNNTPDLRGRFIIGAGDGTGLTSRKIGDKGGEEKHTLTADEIPAHTHDFGGDDGIAGAGYTAISNFNYDADSKGSGNGHRYNSGSVGGGKSHNILPPFYSLAFIMKT